MSYKDIITSQEIGGVKLNVVKGDLLESDAVKVLPINEFFSIEDNDWQAPNPKSVLGQFIKRLSSSQREKFQLDIDTALTRNRSDEGKIGYPYGWTIALQVNGEVVFLTNTVKYELQATSETFAQMKAQDEEYNKKYVRAIEPQWGWIENDAPSKLRKENEWMFDERRVYYDTFLLAIEMCIEGILRAANKKQVKSLALPLLGAGWGGLDEKLVCQAIIGFLKRSLPEQKGHLQEVTLVLPLKSVLDRRFILQDISNALPYGACPDCGKHHHRTPLENLVRIFRDELEIVEKQIADYGGEASLALATRRATLKSELDKSLYLSRIANEDIERRIDELRLDVGEKFDDIRRGQAFIYRRIGIEAQTNTNLLLREFRLQSIEQGEIQTTLDAIRRVLKYIQKSGLPIDDDEVKKTLDDIYQSVNSNLDMHQQLELSLPVIPFLLEYKIGLDAGVDLRAVWKELVAHVKKSQY